MVMTWLMPRSPKRMLISLESVPIVPLGMQNRLTCFTLPVSHSRTCSSENSCAPPPEPSTTPISRCCASDSCEVSIPASRNASVEAASASGTTRETCLRSCASTHASSSKPCTSPAICTGRSLASKLRDAPHAAGAGQNGAAEGLVADAVRADHAHSGYDDAVFRWQQLAFSS